MSYYVTTLHFSNCTVQTGSSTMRRRGYSCSQWTPWLLLVTLNFVSATQVYFSFDSLDNSTHNISHMMHVKAPPPPYHRRSDSNNESSVLKQMLFELHDIRLAQSPTFQIEHTELFNLTRIDELADHHLVHDISDDDDPLDLPALLLPGVTPSPLPPTTPLPPFEVANQTVYLVGDTCRSAVLLTGHPLRCTPTFFCDYPSCACGMTILANGLGVIFSISPMICTCMCQWSLKFIAVAFVLPSLILVNVVIYCCCTNKKCLFHEQFLDARRVLCPWWKIDEVQKWASSLGADNFVVAQESEPDVEMMPMPTTKPRSIVDIVRESQAAKRAAHRLLEERRAKNVQLPGSPDPNGSRSQSRGQSRGSRPFTREGAYFASSTLWLRPGSSMMNADPTRYQIRPGTREAGRPNTQGSGRAGYSTREAYLEAERNFLGSEPSELNLNDSIQEGDEEHGDLPPSNLRLISANDYASFSEHIDEVMEKQTELSADEYERIFATDSRQLNANDFLDQHEDGSYSWDTVAAELQPKTDHITSNLRQQIERTNELLRQYTQAHVPSAPSAPEVDDLDAIEAAMQRPRRQRSISVRFDDQDETESGNDMV